MPLNPPRTLTKREEARIGLTVARTKAEGYLYGHAPVIAAFLAGIILGYAVGAR